MRHSYGIMAEGFALCYAASYNLSSFVGRPALSYTRAFGPDSWGVDVRSGTTPAYAVAFFTDPVNQRKRIHIGIEGAANSAAAMGYANAGWARPTGLTGFVTANANAWAQDIKTRVATSFSTSWAAYWNSPDCGLSITGFSLGGAVAQVLAAMFLKDKPQRLVKCFTFGCPRVGTSNWVSADQHPTDRANWYCEMDPCNQIPLSTTDSPGTLIASPSNPGFAFFAPNNPVSRSRLNGDDMSAPHEPPDRIAVYAQALRQDTPGTPWYFHKMDAYRLMLCNIYADPTDHMSYRIRYLEYPDDNRWGYNFANNRTDFSTLKELGMNGPDVDPNLPTAEQQVIQRPPHVGGADGGIGGGDDDVRVPEVIQIRVNPGFQPRTRRR